MTLRMPNTPCTPHQRLYIRCLLQELELPDDYITKMNMHAFEVAKIPLPRDGARVDDVLESLTRMQADALIKALREEAKA